MQTTVIERPPLRRTGPTAIVLLLVIAVAAGSVALWRTTVSGSGGNGISPGGETSTGATLQKGDQEEEERTGFDPGPFDALLRANVADGRVDYKAFAGSTDFANVLSEIETADVGGMSTDEQLAFWINAYNASVIRNVNAHSGIKSPLDVKGFFDKETFKIAGREVTLNDVENTIIRPTFQEPLIHFGLVCAARSCPPLIPTAYTADNVRDLLAENARNYLADTKQNRFDPKTGVLHLSKIFEWYKEDFGGDDAGLIAFAKEYGPGDMQSGLEKGRKVTVRFVEYDWTLNGK